MYLQSVCIIEMQVFVWPKMFSFKVKLTGQLIYLSTNYLVFKTPRDKYQVMLMSRQMFPGKSTFSMF